ncbi:hypothetical protein AGMMS49942_22420 [Spirochaetia bacterium]|nr:hypothetical protein AGMMS49942_22420 [Spirochaetia bacterium]
MRLTGLSITTVSLVLNNKGPCIWREHGAAGMIFRPPPLQHFAILANVSQTRTSIIVFSLKMT